VEPSNPSAPSPLPPASFEPRTPLRSGRGDVCLPIKNGLGRRRRDDRIHGRPDGRAKLHTSGVGARLRMSGMCLVSSCSRKAFVSRPWRLVRKVLSDSYIGSPALSMIKGCPELGRCRPAPLVGQRGRQGLASSITTVLTSRSPFRPLVSARYSQAETQGFPAFARKCRCTTRGPVG
jgi:hypothetical protein